MRVYVDAFSGEEIISDSFVITPIYDGAGGEVKGRLVVKGQVDVDVGCGNAFGGKNEEDEQEEGGQAIDTTEKVVDIVDAFKYQETSFSRAEYNTYIKGYLKKIKEHLTKTNPDRVQPFMKSVTDLVKFVLGNFDKFTFYVPESYDMDNHIVLAYWKNEETDTAPTFIYFMDGLKETKF